MVRPYLRKNALHILKVSKFVPDHKELYFDPMKYRRIASKLNYLMLIPRCIISFAMSLLSQILNPYKGKIKKLKWIKLLALVIL